MVINIIDFLIFSSQVIDELLTSAFYIQALFTFIFKSLFTRKLHNKRPAYDP